MDWTSFRCECVECRSEPFAVSHNRSEGSATDPELPTLNWTPTAGVDGHLSSTGKADPPWQTKNSITENISQTNHQLEPQGNR